jgi:hypothetical protein
MTMSSVTMMTTGSLATRPMPRGLQVRERGRLLLDLEAASLSSRERAGALASRALAGAPPTTRSLVLELDGGYGHCVLAVGELPAVVWRFDVRTLTALTAAFTSDVPRLDALARLRAEASRLVLSMRLQALRGSIGDIIIVRERPDAVSGLVGAMLLEAIVEHVWREDGEREGATPPAWREGAECHNA